MGIFFFDDMNAAAARLWEHVAPRGRLAVTTWGPRVFEPANTIFWNAVREVRPELYKGFNPWDRISEPAAVADILRAGGAARVDIQVVSRSHPLFSPADWWAIVMGSGYRGIVNLLTPAERATVQRRMMLELSSEHIDEIETNAIYAVAS
jgi:trans-aconitate methyltransferase